MARVIVHRTFPHKLRNGSVLVLEPGAEFQTVKRDVADALIRSSYGVLHESDTKYEAD